MRHQATVEAIHTMRMLPGTDLDHQLDALQVAMVGREVDGRVRLLLKG